MSPGEEGERRGRWCGERERGLLACQKIPPGGPGQSTGVTQNQRDWGAHRSPLLPAPRWPCCPPNLVHTAGDLLPAGASSGPSRGLWGWPLQGSPGPCLPVAGLHGLALPRSPTGDPSVWVGGPLRPPGQKGPQPSQEKEEARPLCRLPPDRHPARLLPVKPAVLLGRPTSTWAQAFIARLRSRPGWQIFGDCIVIADWANRVRLL